MMYEKSVPFGDLKRDYLQHKDEIDRGNPECSRERLVHFRNAMEQFEKTFADYCGVSYSIGVGSGTEALHLALVACRLNHGDEVHYRRKHLHADNRRHHFAGGTLCLVDIERDTMTMDPARVEERITKRTRVITPRASLRAMRGYGCDLHHCRKHGLRVIRGLRTGPPVPCAERAQGRDHGRVPGATASMPVKTWALTGDAGMVVCREMPRSPTVSGSLRNYGQSQRYVHDVKGFNSRLDEIQAAILLRNCPFGNRQ